MARHGPHQVAQKSTSTGLSDFKTSWSKFASVTSTIPLPAIFFLLAVTSFCRRTLHRDGVSGPGCLPRKGDEVIIAALTIGCTSPRVSRKNDPRSKSAENTRRCWESRQGFEETNHLPALGLRKPAPRRHAIFLAPVRKQPEELSRSCLLDAVGVQRGTDVFAFLFALSFSAMACGAVLDKNLATGRGSVRVRGKWVGARTVFRRNFLQPQAVPRFRENSPGKREDQERVCRPAHTHQRFLSLEKA